MSIGQYSSFFAFLQIFFSYLIAIEFFCDTGRQTSYYVIFSMHSFFNQVVPKLISSLVEPEEKFFFPKTRWQEHIFLKSYAYDRLESTAPCIRKNLSKNFLARLSQLAPLKYCFLLSA